MYVTAKRSSPNTGIHILQGDEFFVGYKGLEFMNGLIADMTNDDPVKRPSIDEVSQRFGKILNSLSRWKLRSRVQKRSEKFFVTPFKAVPHWCRRIKFVLTGVPPLPKYPV